MTKCCLALLLLAVTVCGADPDHRDDGIPRRVTEADIIRALKKRDVTQGRPAFGPDPITVAIGYQIKGLTEVNTKQGYLTTAGYLWVFWRDPRLMFSVRSPFSNVKWINIPLDYIWRPSIELYNPAMEGMKFVLSREMVMANYNGSMLWASALSVTSLCPGLAMGQEVAHCPITFGSWTDGLDEMDIVIDPSTSESILSKYTAVGRWTISAASVERVEIVCPVFGTYPLVIYNVTLQKTPKNEGSE